MEPHLPMISFTIYWAHERPRKSRGGEPNDRFSLEFARVAIPSGNNRQKYTMNVEKNRKCKRDRPDSIHAQNAALMMTELI